MTHLRLEPGLRVRRERMPIPVEPCSRCGPWPVAAGSGPSVRWARRGVRRDAEGQPIRAPGLPTIRAPRYAPSVGAPSARTPGASTVPPGRYEATW